VLEDLDRDVYEQTMTRIRQKLGADGMNNAITTGHALTLDDVAEYLNGPRAWR
jgi:hypothetical protein